MKRQRRNDFFVGQVADRLAKARRRHNLTQEVVRFDTGLNVGRIEAGCSDITLSTLADSRAAALTDSTGLDPNIRWSKTGRIQLNEEVTVTLTLDMDIGLFGGFGSVPSTLRSEATGKSEVYWK